MSLHFTLHTYNTFGCVNLKLVFLSFCIKYKTCTSPLTLQIFFSHINTLSSCFITIMPSFVALFFSLHCCSIFLIFMLCLLLRVVALSSSLHCCSTFFSFLFHFCFVLFYLFLCIIVLPFLGVLLHLFFEAFHFLLQTTTSLYPKPFASYQCEKINLYNVQFYTQNDRK